MNRITPTMNEVAISTIKAAATKRGNLRRSNQRTDPNNEKLKNKAKMSGKMMLPAKYNTAIKITESTTILYVLSMLREENRFIWSQ